MSEEPTVKQDSETMSEASDATYGMGGLAKLAADYGAALDGIRKVFRGQDGEDQMLHHIDCILAAVGK